jgi:tetratricopeptide (TPR) repeat protein
MMKRTLGLFVALLLLTVTLGWAQDPAQSRFDQAMSVFRSAEQYESIALFESIIDELEGRPELTEEARSLLARSYFQRAEVHFNFGENDDAAISLRSAIRTNPNLAVDMAMISPKLAELLEQTRDQVVGYLESAVTPNDATAYVEGAPPLMRGGRISLLGGQYTVRIERPGYASQEITLVVPAGQTTRLDTVLSRTSAVLYVITEVEGVTVFVDGEERGTTADDGIGRPQLVVGGLAPGTHSIELQSRGYRNRRLELDLGAADDFETDVLSMDATNGTVRLAGLLDGAVVRVNGAPQRYTGESASFIVPVGFNRIEVDYRGIGRFIREINIADGQAMGFDVELRPVIALLGVLGGDEVSGRQLHEGIKQFFAGTEGWSVADHADRGQDVLAGTGMDKDRLRELSSASSAQIARVDWTALQKAGDEKVGASAYMIAVLSDDLFASSADLWILPASPHPAVPQKIRAEVGGPEVVARALEPIGKRPKFDRPWLGVRLIETNADSGLVVLNVTEGSPAASAGLKPGDIITSVRGVEIIRLAQLNETLSTIEPHSDLPLSVSRPDGNSTVHLVLGSSPSVLPWTDPDTFYPLYLAWLEIEQATGQSEIEPWLIQLNQASAFMGLGTWEEAIRLLRNLRAPTGVGVGQPMVDYWLGMALARTDPNTYKDVAVQALSRAEGAPDGRLYHNDGPRVAPLAAATKKSLTGGGS